MDTASFWHTEDNLMQIVAMINNNFKDVTFSREHHQFQNFNSLTTGLQLTQRFQSKSLFLNNILSNKWEHNAEIQFFSVKFDAKLLGL